ncbi:MAG: DUF4158 domain-containing protein [Rhodobacter sp.]|nr:DUF4158 domain-containing protein [Rhodobacter sp.]
MPECILSTNEQEAFDKPPAFDHRDRKKFLDFPKFLLTTAATMRQPGSSDRVSAGCGYFPCNTPVFCASRFWERDLAYVASQLGHPLSSTVQYPDRTRQRHQKIILDFHGFAPFDQGASYALVTESLATMGSDAGECRILR